MSTDFYIKNCYQISKLVTKKYSTSFSLATSLLKKKTRDSIFAIYGFVRLADEIVDSFHGYDKEYLLDKLYKDLIYALENKISTNTIIVAFADTVNKYNIDINHINAFMNSMKYDLNISEYKNTSDLDEYIYGSADVVGLMCLKVFCDGNIELYNQLESSAKKLGSAFQKVNFLRDIKSDIDVLGRTYFPEISNNQFNEKTKREIEKNIEVDFSIAKTGIKRLPGRSKLAVAIAYYYYLYLFRKIKNTSHQNILSQRIRISNIRKYFIILRTMIEYKFKII